QPALLPDQGWWEDFPYGQACDPRGSRRHLRRNLLHRSHRLRAHQPGDRPARPGRCAPSRDGERHALTIKATRPRRHGLDTVPGRPAAPLSARGSPRDSFVGPDAYPPGKRPAVIFRRPRRDAVLPALGLLVAFASADVGATPTALRGGHGIHVEATEQLDSRQLEVPVRASALPGPADWPGLAPSDH